ncbi:MAG TPA: hypothetical protein PKM43_08540 [Verrucomicrobiota bacterium]|mgnify:CR=1 FL=1|nr:hypothetical protein [Verrucomicrobiota bacterium]
METEQELKMRIEALERENQALRAAAKTPGKANIIIVTESSYQGQGHRCHQADARLEAAPGGH